MKECCGYQLFSHIASPNIYVPNFIGFSIFFKYLNTSKELGEPLKFGSLLYKIKFIAYT